MLAHGGPCQGRKTCQSEQLRLQVMRLVMSVCGFGCDRIYMAKALTAGFVTDAIIIEPTLELRGADAGSSAGSHGNFAGGSG